MDENALSHEIIGAAIEVHKVLGPGMLEFIYEEALVIELEARELNVVRQAEVEVFYKNSVPAEQTSTGHACRWKRYR